jgi:hypothetical protein
MTTTITPAATTAATVNYALLTKAGIAQLITETYGYTPPTSWTKVRMIEAMEGGYAPRSKGAKTQLRAAYLDKAGIVAPKSWTCAKLMASVTGEVVYGRGQKTKDAARTAYAAKMGVAPAKTWTTATIVAKAAANIAPKAAVARSTGGLTAVKCKELIKAARATDAALEAATKGYYKLTADALRAMVAQYNLAY